MTRSAAWTCSVALALSMVALSGCKGDPATPEYWGKALDGARNSKERLRLLDDLRESKRVNPSFLPLLHKHLRDEKRAEVKTSVVRILNELKDPSSVEPLSEAIEWAPSDGASNGLNKEIAVGLGLVGQAQATPTLLKMVKLKDNFTRVEAINALGLLRAKEAVPALIELAGDESISPFINKKAIEALGHIGDPKAVPVLVKMMFRERQGISFYVESSFALYQLGSPAADAVLPVLKNEDKELLAWAREKQVKEAALWAKAAQVLGDLHDPRSEKDLVKRLNYDDPYLDVKLFVRMRMADALGRMRSKEAVKPLSAMLGEEEATARGEYTRALARIGSRDAIPGLLKSATQGSWDAREGAMSAVALLGDEREKPAFEKWAAEEEKLTTAECQENPDYMGCKEPAALAKKHVEHIQALTKPLEAGAECKTDSACWAKKLTDPDARVRERAAYEVGRSGRAEHLEALAARLTEENLDTRIAVIMATDWLIHDNKEAAAKAQGKLADLEKQIAEEKGRQQFVKVNEDLRRLAVKIRRQGT